MDYLLEVKQALSTVVRVERVRKNLSQEELALNSDLQRKFISDIETCRHQPSIGSLIRIIKGLDMNFLDFMTEFDKELKNYKIF